MDANESESLFEQAVERLSPGACPTGWFQTRLGYFVIYVNCLRSRLFLEHYGSNGVLNKVIEGQSIGARENSIRLRDSLRGGDPPQQRSQDFFGTHAFNRNT